LRLSLLAKLMEDLRFREDNRYGMYALLFRQRNAHEE